MFCIASRLCLFEASDWIQAYASGALKFFDLVSQELKVEVCALTIVIVFNLIACLILFSARERLKLENNEAIQIRQLCLPHREFECLLCMCLS